MSFPYKNPISPSQLSGQQSLDRTKTYGTSYSTLSTGGFMEVYSLDQLYYTIPPSTFGPIEFSGNSIPITFSKGSGTTFSFDTLTLQPDNISSGRRKQGMLVYVKEVDQVYQYNIDNYFNLFTAATASTGTVVISDFGTTIKSNSSAGITFINAWTANTIDGVSGVSRTNAVWKKYYGSNLALTGGTYSYGTTSFINTTGGTFSVTGYSKYFVTAATPSGYVLINGDRWFDTTDGSEAVYINNQWVEPSVGGQIFGFYLPLSGGTVSGGTNFTAGLSANTISSSTINLGASTSTINLNNTTQQQIKFYSGGTGVPQISTYSQGTKIILYDNIDSSSSTGIAIGVDTGTLWYGTDLTGNGHDWYAGTRKLATLIGANGFQLFGLGSPTTTAMSISGTSTLGSKGGLGYMDFLRVYNNYPSATNPNKWFRTTSGGTLQFLNNAYTATIFDLTDNGILAVGGGNTAAASSNDGTSNYLSFNNNSTQIYDDGNTHIHSRSVGASMWINTNQAQLNLLTQSPTSTGGIGSGIAIATTTLNGYVTINTGRTITTAASYGYLVNSASPTGQYGGGSQSVTISLYANNRIWGQEIDAFSDERMKDIQGEISLEEGLKLVNNLKPIKYTWKEGEDKGLKAGYSAQQVIKSGFDHLVSLIPNEGLEEKIDEDGFFSPKDTQFSMNYDQVTPYHGVVIKHLLEEIEKLKKEIKELKNNIN